MGKIIRVDPKELERVANQLTEISGTYTEIYTQLMQEASTMGTAWDGEDNLAFVEQINGFTDDLKMMAEKLNTAAETLKKQKANYVGRQEDNIAQVRKLAN